MSIFHPHPAPKHLLACEECDLLYRLASPATAVTLLCTRCGAILGRPTGSRLEVPLAYALASMIFFILTNTQPLLSLDIGGRIQESTLFSGVLALADGGLWKLAVLVFLTSLLAPFFQIALLIYVLLPLWAGRRPWQMGLAFRLLIMVSPWSMLGIYMLGILVAMVKLKDLATVIPGLSLFFFTCLILTSTAAKTTLDTETLWSHAEKCRS